MTRAFPLLMPIALLLATPALSTDGAAPIWQPTTITQSGKYRVTRNITSATSPAISILADDVEIDLNGFTVSGGISGLGANALNEPSITIENGTVIGTVIVGADIGTAIVRNLVVKNGGIFVGDSADRVVIENNVIHDADSGIGSSARIAVVRNNVVIRAKFQGIVMDDCQVCEIVGNVVANSQGMGIYVTSSSGRVVKNTVEFCAGDGIVVGFQGSEVEGNVARGNQGSGIVLSGERNQIVGNVSTGNAAFGIRLLSNDNVYRGNTARGNQGAGCTNPAGNANFCDGGTGNTSHGDNYMPSQM